MSTKTFKKRFMNAQEFPRILYGLHFYPGVAEYRGEGEEPFRIYVPENAIRRMGPTFAGKPVYVRHVNEVNLRTIQQDADGWVIESFFNKADGKHWTKFIVVSDKGQQAIRNGGKLSNCYVPTQKTAGGLHNGVDYDEELVDGRYEHLAIVDDPRYEESVVLSPEEFKDYCTEKEAELTRLTNAKDKKKVSNKGERKIMGLKMFKREEIEDALDLEATLVELPKSGKEVTLKNAIEAADKLYNMHGYANADHMVKVGEEEMSVKQLTNKYMAACKNAEEEGEEVENEADEEEEPEMKNKKKNAGKKKNEGKFAKDDEKEEPEMKNKKKNSKLENEADEEAAEEQRKLRQKKLKNARKEEDLDEEEDEDAIENSADDADEDDGDHYHRLMNASGSADDADGEVIELMHDRVARGKERY